MWKRCVLLWFWKCATKCAIQNEEGKKWKNHLHTSIYNQAITFMHSFNCSMCVFVCISLYFVWPMHLMHVFHVSKVVHASQICTCRPTRLTKHIFKSTLTTTTFFPNGTISIISICFKNTRAPNSFLFFLIFLVHACLHNQYTWHFGINSFVCLLCVCWISLCLTVTEE